MEIARREAEEAEEADTQRALALSRWEARQRLEKRMAEEGHRLTVTAEGLTEEEVSEGEDDNGSNAEEEVEAAPSPGHGRSGTGVDILYDVIEQTRRAIAASLLDALPQQAHTRDISGGESAGNQQPSETTAKKGQQEDDSDPDDLYSS